MCCELCSCFSCIISCISGYCGKLIVIICSIAVIAMGIAMVILINLVANSALAQSSLSTQSVGLGRGIGIGVGVGCIVFGFAGIFGVIFNGKCIGKLLMFLYTLFMILLFAALIVCGILLIVFLFNSSSLLDKVCDATESWGPIDLYSQVKTNSISSGYKSPSSCPKSCSGTSSLKIIDCPSLRTNFNINSYADVNYAVLETLEANWKCTGICPRHSGIACNFFADFSVAAYSSTCLSSLSDWASYNFKIALIVIIVSLVVIAINISTGFAIYCNPTSKD